MTSHAFTSDDTVKRHALVGVDVPDSERYALYLQDRDSSLSMSGKSRIIGKAYLPAAGIRKAYIEGFTFIGENPVDGLTEISNRSIPELDQKILATIKKTLFKSNAAL